jgi:hypothetical protein
MRHSAALAVVLAAGISAPAQASSITLEGFTTGCFGAGCSTYSDNATSGGLTFNGSAFTLTISDAPGNPSIAFLAGDFGTLALDGDEVMPSNFTLHIEFTASDLVSPVTGDLHATTTRAGSSGNSKVDWQNDALVFMFADDPESGGFSVRLGNRTVNPSGPRSLEPTLTLLPADSQEPEPTTEIEPVEETVPEPGTLALVGSGFLAAAWRRRRAGARPTAASVAGPARVQSINLRAK